MRRFIGFLCKMGIHLSWYSSGWVFGSVNRCSYCHTPDNRYAAERIARMEARYLSLSKSIPYEQRIGMAMMAEDANDLFDSRSGLP